MHTVVAWKMFGDMTITKLCLHENNFCTTNYSSFPAVLYEEHCFVLVMKS